MFTQEQIDALWRSHNLERGATMIQSPHLWPCRPLLPLKDHSDWNRVGVIYETNKLRVYLCNMFMLRTDAPPPPNDVRYIDYIDVWQLLADGWSVD